MGCLLNGRWVEFLGVGLLDDNTQRVPFDPIKPNTVVSLPVRVGICFVLAKHIMLVGIGCGVDVTLRLVSVDLGAFL